MSLPRWAIAAIVLVTMGIIAVVAIAVAGVYFVTQQVHIREASPASAARRFEEGRARFDGAQPLIELDSEGDIVRSRLAEVKQAGGASTARLDALHVLVWDADDEKIVELAIPFWLLRMKSGPIDVFSDTAGLRRSDLRLTVEDLERLGPTLLVDHRHRGGDRVLVWTQ